MNLDDIETELSRRIASCHQAEEIMDSKTGIKKLRAKAQGLSEMLSWLRFERKTRNV